MLIPDQITVLESDLYSRKICRVTDNKLWSVERVYVERWTLSGGDGWWLILLLKDAQDSHTVVYWQNLTCTEKGVLKSIQKAQEEYRIV